MAPEYRSDAQVRAKLEQLIRQERQSRAGLSRLLGHRDDYVGRYLRRGVPQRLPDDEASRLARYFDVPAVELGVPPWAGNEQ